MLRNFFHCSLVFLASFSIQNVVAAQYEFDVVVYGSTPSGIMASVQAAEMGKKTLLISPSKYIGGVMTSGLCATDMNSYRLIGGQPRKFFQKVNRYYQDPSVWRAETRDEYFARSVKRVYTGKADSVEMQWVFEPHVALKIFREMLRDSNVSLADGERLELRNGVVKKGNVIESIRMESGKEYRAKMFIDTTYEGDLMARSGVSYFVGREPNSRYNERFNGVRGTRMDKLFAPQGGTIEVDPYVTPGDKTSGLLPFIEPAPRGKDGDGDHGFQAYCFRFTLTNDPNNRTPIAKPANYNPLWFEMYGRICAANPRLELSKLLGLAPLPNKKADVNAANIPGANYAWAEGNYATRSSLAQLHRDFALGKLWFVANDSRVPQSLRDEINQYGLPKDEFTDNGNFPHQIYVREARRMISDYVMTEHNELKNGSVIAEDGIAFGSYAVDSHQVGYFVDEQGTLCIDGSLWESARPYPISYRSIVPKESECSNLIVPVCLSSSHTAYGSIRMEPVYMVMGHSAGTAAAMSIDRQCSLQRLPYAELRAQLESQGQIFVKTN
ncbi:MAG: FAD-dependent oxidoreductase [Pirellula sp.]